VNDRRNCSDPLAPAGLRSEPRRKPWVWLVYALLLALAIPWYWPAGYRGPLLLGFPLWAAATVLCVVLLAGWTCWVIAACWRDGE
jgi:hypothetical protein